MIVCSFVSFLSTNLLADPNFVDQLTKRINYGMEANQIVRIEDMAAHFAERCEILRPKFEPLFARVDEFLQKKWVDEEETQRLFDSAEGTTKEKIKPVLRYLDGLMDPIEDYCDARDDEFKRELKQARSYGTP